MYVNTEIEQKRLIEGLRYVQRALCFFAVSADRGEVITYGHLDFSCNLCLSLVGKLLKLYSLLCCAWKSREVILPLAQSTWDGWIIWKV